MLIEVSQDDIDHGTRGSRQSCMVGLAMRRVYGNRFVGCGMSSVSLRGETGWALERRLPLEAIQAIYDFEGGVRKVEPFAFEFKE